MRRRKLRRRRKDEEGELFGTESRTRYLHESKETTPATRLTSNLTGMGDLKSLTPCKYACIFSSPSLHVCLFNDPGPVQPSITLFSAVKVPFHHPYSIYMFLVACYATL